MEYQVEQLRQQNPEKYRLAQAMGEELMSYEYTLDVGNDQEGERIRAKTLLNDIIYYSINDTELSSLELELLTKVYGDNWKKLT